MPESPKYLLSMKRYDDARKAINYISKMNGTGLSFNGLFDREVIDRRSLIALNHSTFVRTSEIDVNQVMKDSERETVLITPKVIIREE